MSKRQIYYLVVLTVLFSASAESAFERIGKMPETCAPLTWGGFAIMMGFLAAFTICGYEIARKDKKEK